MVNPVLYTQIAIVDEQHWTIYKTVEAAHERIDDGFTDAELDEFLQTLYALVLTHIGTEEGFMAISDYPNPAKQAHIDQHNYVKSLIREQLYKPAAECDLRKLVLLLQNWINYHLETQDKKLGEHLQSFLKCLKSEV